MDVSYIVLFWLIRILCIPENIEVVNFILEESIPRLLVADNKILLLDEATGAVMKREIQNTILDIYYNAKFDPTILNVTHSIEDLSNRIYILAPNPCKVQAVIDVNFDGRRTDAIRQTTAFANYVKQVEQVMSETHE